jgi:hypothetical protein
LNYFSAVGISDVSTRIRLMVRTLSGDALQWWLQEMKINAVLPTQWDVWEDRLYDRFKPRLIQAKLKKKLQALRQTKSVAAYVDIFRSTYVEISDMHLDLAIEYFIDGLSEDVRRLVFCAHLDRPYLDMESVFKAALNHGYVIESGALAKKASTSVSTPSGSSTMAYCRFCKKNGHVKSECRKFAAWKLNNPLSTTSVGSGRPSNSGGSVSTPPQKSKDGWKKTWKPNNRNFNNNHNNSNNNNNNNNNNRNHSGNNRPNNANTASSAAHEAQADGRSRSNNTNNNNLKRQSL